MLSRSLNLPYPFLLLCGVLGSLSVLRPLSLWALFPLTVTIVYTFIRVMSIGFYTFFRAKLHKKILCFSCNITLGFVYFLGYNNGKVVGEGLKIRRPH